MLNDSPSSTAHERNCSSTCSSYIRTDTPIHHFQNENFIQNYRQPSPDYQAMYGYQNIKNQSSPQPEEMPTHHRPQHQEYPADSSMPQRAEQLNSYLLQAVALQQIQSRMIERGEANVMSPNLPLPVRLNHPPTIPMVVGRDGKLARPFKAYPRDPLTISATFTATDPILDRDSNENYTTFRKQMLDRIHAANGGQPTISNPKMRRSTTRSISSLTSDEDQSEKNEKPKSSDVQVNSDNSSNGAIKDKAYYERRKKNNAAAKKSRDRRRVKEDEIAIRAAFLERENMALKIELAAMKRQLENIHGLRRVN